VAVALVDGLVSRVSCVRFKERKYRHWRDRSDKRSLSCCGCDISLGRHKSETENLKEEVSDFVLCHCVIFL
jgi:hypothetical protein